MWTNLAWPIFFLIIILFFREEIKILMKSIADISNKSKTISYMGFNLDLGTNSDVLISSQQNDNKQQNLMKAFQSPLVTSKEEIIRKQLIDSGCTNEQAINTLIHHLANANLQIALVVIHDLIFPEQIKLLSYLNSQFQIVPEVKISKFYNEWQEKLKPEDKINYTKEQFIGFLKDRNLIIQNIDGYTIGPLGQEFLKFLVLIKSPKYYNL